jgi:hypothetical protein
MYLIPVQGGCSGATAPHAHRYHRVRKTGPHTRGMRYRIDTRLPRLLEAIFLKLVGRNGKDILSVLFFSALLGRLAWPVWSNLKHLHHRLDDLFGRIEAVQQSLKVIITPPPQCTRAGC